MKHWTLFLLAWLLVTPGFAARSLTNAPAVVTNASTIMVTNRCPEFALADQFDTLHTLKFPISKPIVLTVADKKGSDDIEAWAHPLWVKFGEQIQIEGLADMSAVPGVLRGHVQGKFKKAISYPVMLDWQGKIARSFGYEKAKANVYLIAPDGRVLHHFAGEADEGKLKELSERIELLLKERPAPPQKAAAGP